jgi:uncharacterized membrane protein YeiH
MNWSHSLITASAWAQLSLGNFTIVDLIAASTNAFNAALLVRRPDHWKDYTIVGIVLFAFMGGIAGGVSRDLILGKVPAALLNPWYLFFSFDAALLASVLHYRSGQRIREGLLQFATSLSLPWYAIVGANAALQAKLPYVSAVLIGIIGSTAGRFLVDLSCGVTPKLFVRGEWFVGTAVLASVAYIVCDAGLKLSIWPASLISFVIAFLFRCTALLRHWEEPEPEPWGPAEPSADEPDRPRLQEQIRREFHKDD